MTWGLLALVVRALVAVRTLVPSHDAAFYLWAAEAVAAGEPGAAFRILFQPLYPLCVGGLLSVAKVIGCSLSTVVAGQLIGVVAGALAVVPLFLAVQRLESRRTAHLAVCFYCVGLWFCRHPAACLSEGLFYLWVATTLWAVVSGRSAVAGLATGLAVATRPDGLLLMVLAILVPGRRLRFVLALVAVLVLLASGFAVAGEGFVMSTKGRFVLAEGVGGVLARDGLVAALSAWGANLVRNLGVSFEAVGYLVLPLAVLGCVVRWSLARWLVLVFAMQLMLASLLRSHVRFPSGYAVLLLPLAAIGFERMRLARRWFVPVLMLVVLPDLLRLPVEVNARRAVLPALGAWLRPQLGADRRLATDLVRLEFFAGQRPWLPRRIAGPEFLERCRDPASRFVAYVPGRRQLRQAALRDLGFEPVRLPSQLRVPWLVVWSR